jgi:hypothetical protein
MDFLNTLLEHYHEQIALLEEESNQINDKVTLTDEINRFLLSYKKNPLSCINFKSMSINVKEELMDWLRGFDEENIDVVIPEMKKQENELIGQSNNLHKDMSLLHAKIDIIRQLLDGRVDHVDDAFDEVIHRGTSATNIIKINRWIQNDIKPNLHGDDA